jgi:hypothetical protein
MYVKTMSAHGSHLGWRSWSPDIILKVYYPRTIHAMSALNWPTGFRGEDLKQFSHRSYVNLDVFGMQTFLRGLIYFR